MGKLYKLNCYFLKKKFLQLYHALIYPHLLYIIPIWGSTYKSYPHKILILQNKAVRIGYQDKMEFERKPFMYQPKGLKTEQTLPIWS